MEVKAKPKTRIVAGIETTAAVEKWPFPPAGVRVQAQAKPASASSKSAKVARANAAGGAIAKWLEEN
jgi:hypothetical protein